MNTTITKKVTPNKSLLTEMTSLQNNNFSNQESLNTVIDSHTYSFKLPSNGYFNDGISLIKLKPLTIGQVSDISKYVKQDKTSLRSLTSILSHSVFGIDINDLTLNDFYAMCFELRFISYTDPIVISKEEKIGDQVYTLEKALIRESLSVTDLKSPMIVDGLDSIKVVDKIFELENGGEMSLLEKSFFGYAKGSTPSQKLDNFRMFSLEKLDLIAEFAVKNNHGVSSKVKLFNEDGTFEEMGVEFSHEMFFPRIIREYLHRLDV